MLQGLLLQLVSIVLDVYVLLDFYQSVKVGEYMNICININNSDQSIQNFMLIY